MVFREYLHRLATDQRGGIGAGLLKPLLFLLSIVYGLVVRSLAQFCSLRRYQPQVKVISVGNITLGGTGKTMLVEYLAGLLERDGRRIALVSRGYKKPAKGEGVYAEFGDEPGMLKKKFPALPVFSDPDRLRSLRSAAAQGAEAAVLDDGFQQWRIRKDLDIVCIDAAGFGNGCLIPRGILREPLSALRRAGVFVITNTGLVEAEQVRGLKGRLRRLNPRALIVESDHEPRGVYRVPGGESCRPADLKKTGFVCAIGNPESFLGCCRRAGLGDGPKFIFPDHHAFVRQDIRRIASCCLAEGIDAVVTTEKDEMRLPFALMEEYGLRLYVLGAAVRIMSNEQEFTSRLRRLFPA